ncbi:Uncharacterised protein [Clostridium baratii]|uniref:hypothetical protein n=1 Tax=Clostridium baratii TaxID=1561 RepID=UPI0006BFA042|nr:hypothetical protein [Clostridium baratii]CUP17053.1 Uncharacterised protein [Clostridium baratii]
MDKEDIVGLSVLGLIIIIVSTILSYIIVEKINYREEKKNEQSILNNAEYDNGQNKSFTENNYNNQDYNNDTDRIMFHSVDGDGEVKLPIKYKNNYVIYKDNFYVTNNKGKTYIKIPDDYYLNYAKISEYKNDIEESNLYIKGNKISIIYGGRGSQNVSVMTSDDGGKAFGVNTISKTANHDLKNGYKKMYIDFLGDGKNGYVALIDKDGKKLLYRTVNDGATWDKVDEGDELYKTIIHHFKL